MIGNYGSWEAQERDCLRGLMLNSVSKLECRSKENESGGCCRRIMNLRPAWAT